MKRLYQIIIIVLLINLAFAGNVLANINSVTLSGTLITTPTQNLVVDLNRDGLYTAGLEPMVLRPAASTEFTPTKIWLDANGKRYLPVTNEELTMLDINGDDNLDGNELLKANVKLGTENSTQVSAMQVTDVNSVLAKPVFYVTAPNSKIPTGHPSLDIIN